MLANSGKLSGCTLFITGASRGIGKAIALKAAKDGANVVLAAKTAEPHPKLPGTIYTAAKEIESAGGRALPCIVDVREEATVAEAVENAVKTFGGIDILINNASAISLTGTLETPMKKYDLMNQINARGTYMVSRSCLPHLLNSKNPHILNISPPLNLNPRWFKGHVAYTMAKYGMSMCVLGMSEEFRDQGVGVNALWPRTAIITAAMEMLGGEDVGEKCRKPEIMADAAYAILTRDSKTYNGNFAIDDDVLREEGISDFDQYAFDPKGELMPDFFLDDFDANFQKSMMQEVKKQQDSQGVKGKQASEGGGLEQIFDKMATILNPELVKKVNAVYSFEVTDSVDKQWFLNLREGAGQCGRGDPPVSADTTLKMNESDFKKMFGGSLKPTAAFMTGKLKISGDMSKAMKLEALMGKLKSKL